MVIAPAPNSAPSSPLASPNARSCRATRWRRSTSRSAPWRERLDRAVPAYVLARIPLAQRCNRRQAVTSALADDVGHRPYRFDTSRDLTAEGDAGRKVATEVDRRDVAEPAHGVLLVV